MLPCDETVVPTSSPACPVIYFKLISQLLLALDDAEPPLFVFVVELGILEVEDLVKVVQDRHHYEEGEDDDQRDLTLLHLDGLGWLFVTGVEAEQLHTDVVNQRNQREDDIFVVSKVDGALEGHQDHCHNGHIVVQQLVFVPFKHILQVDEQVIA